MKTVRICSPRTPWLTRQRGNVPSFVPKRFSSMNGRSTYASSARQPRATEIVHNNLLEFLSSPKRIEIPHSQTFNLRNNELPADALPTLLRASFFNRHLERCMGPLETEGTAHYSILSGGEEMFGILAHAFLPQETRAFLHYRHGLLTLLWAILLGKEKECKKEMIREFLCLRTAPNGGRHRMNSNIAYGTLPVTPDVGSQFPQALALAVSLHLPNFMGFEGRLENVRSILVSGGDGTINQPAFLSTINRAHYFINRPSKPIKFGR